MVSTAQVSHHSLTVFWMCSSSDKEFVFPVDAVCHENRLGKGRCTVIHGGVGNVHAGEHGDHGLKFEDRLQGALTHLGLIGSITSGELTSQDQVPDESWTVMPIGPRTKESRHLIRIRISLLLMFERGNQFSLGKSGR